MSTKTTMRWSCYDCRAAFDGPTDHAPANGCPQCGSPRVLDLNAAPIKILPRQLPANCRATNATARAIARTGDLPRPKVALLVRKLREKVQATKAGEIKKLLTEAADELERLSQLPLL